VTPRAFLNSLWPHKPADLYILIWTLPDKSSHWFRDVAAAADFVQTAHGVDVFVGVGIADHDYGQMHRCPSTEIAGIAGFCADFDLRSEAHPKPTLPATIDEALSLLPLEFPPSIIVLTGNGIHVWWLFREPWIFESAEERRSAATLVGRWHTLLRDNASQRGWSYERLADLARVLRVPATTNWKDPANPKPVVVHSQTDFRYNPSELADFLDDREIRDEETQALAAREWAERIKDTPIVMNLAARIPDEMLNRWLEADTRFKNTWFRQRQDLPDQSQSGYELALCNFGFRNKLSEQQIVDLLIHHRALHKQKHRTRIDYFQRTLAKAARAFTPSPLLTAHAETTGPSGSQRISAGTSPSGVTWHSKAEICRRISAAFEIEVLRIVKISGTQPLFRMETAAGNIEFDNVGKLISQQGVRTAIAATAGKLIPRFRQKLWDEIVQSMLDSCIVEEGSEELHQKGAAIMHISHYLTETTFIPSIDGQVAQDLRRPMVRDGRITVCASDLQMYINKTTQQNLPVRTVAGMLSAIGALTVRVRSKKIKEQSRWEMPLSEFDPADYVVQESDGQVDQNG
jgi:hypothetical protein